MMIIFVLIFLSSLSQAKNLQLMFGGGFNASSIQTSGRPIMVAPGINSKADLGYYYSDQWALEWSTQFTFSKVKHFIVWDTHMTVGTRYRFNNSTLFTRFFAGGSPTVFILTEDKMKQNTEASRVHYLGPVFGASLGKMFKTKKGMDWFIETSITYQEIRDGRGVTVVEGVPVNAFTTEENNQIYILRVYAMIGMRVF